MSTDLAPLIARVEAATGPDRRLDLDICAALGTLEYGPTARGWTRHPHPELTASLDAALALVERVLPGALYEVKALPHRRGHGASLWSDNPSAERMLSRADAPTPALALLLALLRALQAEPSRER